MKELKVGFLGAGFMGTSHARSLQQIEGTTIEAVCSVPLAPAEHMKADLGLEGTRVYDDFDRMLAEESLDALYVCIPPFAHEGQVVKAAQRGLHLFLEKPIAFDGKQAADMVAAIESAGVKSQVGFHYRFRKSVRALRSRIANGEAGRPTLFAGRYWTNMMGNDWWRDVKGSRGQVYEQLIHIYDLAAFFLGAPETAFGMIDNLCHGEGADYTIEDTSMGSVRFANGAMASVTGSNCAVPMHFFGDFRVVCENATLDYVSTGQGWVEPERAVLYLGEDGREEFIEDGEAYLPETEDFVRAVREDGQPMTPARDGLKAIRLVEAVMESAAEGRPVTLEGREQ